MEPWQLWVDTGGTFTDALAISPEGALSRAKVLSSSALRGRLAAAGEADGRVEVADLPKLPPGFAAGARFVLLESAAFAAEVIASEERQLTLSAPCAAPAGAAFELRFAEEAPVLAARVLTGAANLASLPPLRVRLATTRGTNALLERKGAPTAFFVTRGFGDLLTIGNQQRPDLFALEIVRPSALHGFTVEVPERLAADGATVEPLDLEALAPEVEQLRARGCAAAGVALLHSYLDSRHEASLAAFLRARGFAWVSASAELSPTIGILPRAQTAVVDAYLSPIIGAYLEQVGVLAAAPGSSLHVMSSAGGLLPAGALRAKDTLLSGPAGGVVGAAAAGRAAGFARVLGFDMGGTSTDVCLASGRAFGELDYTFEHEVGGARVAAPALRIETVAAGGGSLCRLAGGQLKVGPESAGAAPGPAAYGAGGPLTLTDVNLLLGRLRTERFAIPIDRRAAEAALAEIATELPEAAAEELLLGFLEIANERMAEAMRRVSIRQGYDPAEHALVAFGGAGGQHACAIADLLGIPAVILPVDAGLLSARGLGEARLERFAQRQLLQPLEGLAEQLGERLRELEDEAESRLEADGLAPAEIEIRRRLVFLRFLGQENALELELGMAPPQEGELAAAFRELFEQIYGYSPQERPIEVVALRVAASQRRAAGSEIPPPPAAKEPHPPFGHQEAFFDGAYRAIPCHDFAPASEGAYVDGPALLFDASASLVIEEGWRAVRAASGSWVATRRA